MSNNDLWIVYENTDGDTEVHNSYEKALERYEVFKDHEAEESEGFDTDSRVYMAKVTKFAEWIENKDMPILEEIEDENGDVVETGDYYWEFKERDDDGL